MLGHELAEAVLCLAPNRDERMAGVDEGLHSTGRAALRDHPVESVAVHGECVGDDFLRSAVVPVADHLDDLPGTAGRIEDFMDADGAVAVDRVAGEAADLKDLA